MVEVDDHGPADTPGRPEDDLAAFQRAAGMVSLPSAPSAPVVKRDASGLCPIIDAFDVISGLHNIDVQTWRRAGELRDLLLPHQDALRGLRGEDAKRALRRIDGIGEEVIALLTQQKFLK